MTDTTMNLRLHNTRTRRVEAFSPLDPQRVTMYLCGPTVYNYVHIGNARGPVAFGVLTVDTAEQAEERIDKGADAARAALEMADLFSQVRRQARG